MAVINPVHSATKTKQGLPEGAPALFLDGIGA